MNYAQDIYKPDLLQILLSMLPASSDPLQGMQLWILVDGVMLDADVRGYLINKASRKRQILGVSNYSVDDIDHGPIIMQPPISALDRVKWLGQLIQACSGRPALSVIETHGSQEQLEDVLAALIVARTEDGQRFYLRYADTRVLPSLVKVLHESQRVAITSTISRWHYVDRQGQLKEAMSTNDRRPVVKPTQITFDERQFSQMLDTSETDNIFGLLCDCTPGLIPKEQRGEFFCKLQNILDEARRKKVTDAPDQLQFAILALSVGEEFFQHPILSDTWDKIYKNNGTLQKLMKEWPDEVWHALEQRETMSP